MFKNKIPRGLYQISPNIDGVFELIVEAAEKSFVVLDCPVETIEADGDGDSAKAVEESSFVKIDCPVDTTEEGEVVLKGCTVFETDTSVVVLECAVGTKEVAEVMVVGIHDSVV